MLRRIEGHTINCKEVKQFYCKNCKTPVDVIYKDDMGNTYCDKCKPDVTTARKEHNK